MINPSQFEICAIVVTYNRLTLLERCLSALTTQTLAPNRIVVVDNASTDGSGQWLQEWVSGSDSSVRLIALDENTGGAGGFSAGIDAGISEGYRWIWIMDDDAEPHPSALEELMKVAVDSSNVYGSLAVNGEDTSWITTLLEESPRVVDKASNVPAQSRVQSLPFLGFLIHRDLVRKIGLPDAGYFIAADDIEYCMRAERAGAQICIAGLSHIEHPKSRPYEIKLPGYKLTALELPPWKRYYDTRNRLLIAHEYYGARMFTQTIPGSFVRLFATLTHEPRKVAQLWAFSAGLIDGLLGLKGRRHAKWGIRQ